MRNLNLVDACSFEVEENHKRSLICCNNVQNVVYLVSSKGLNVTYADDSSYSIPNINWADNGIETVGIVSADVITALDLICITTEEGDIFTVGLGSFEVEIVGNISDGISCCCWSPDEELFVIVSKTNSLILMNSFFDPIEELDLDENQSDANQFVNVGWGKKETQFHGSVGKEAAKEKQAGETPVQQWDDLKSRISWRGDGQLFSVSFVINSPDNGNKYRKIQVFNREAILQYTNEPTKGLEQALNWKPTGSLIASSQILPNKSQIIFFEKNGLKHGEFILPYKPGEMIVKDLFWNSSSSVLLVWLQSFKEEIKEEIVQLWTTGNYHWYMKHQLKFNSNISSIKWDLNNPLKLYILAEKQLQLFSWIEKVNCSKGLNLTDLAQVAVMNGNKVNFTPFKQCVVPPPMCAYEAVFPSPPHAIIFAPGVCNNNNKNKALSENNDSGFLENDDAPEINSNSVCIPYGEDMFAFLVPQHSLDEQPNDDIKIVVNMQQENGFSMDKQIHKVIGIYKLDWGIHSRFISHCKLFSNWLWVSRNVVISSYRNKNSTKVLMFTLDKIGYKNGSISLSCVIDVEGMISCVASSCDGSLVIAQMEDSSIKHIDLVNETVFGMPSLEFKNVCKDISLCRLAGNSEIQGIGLTASNQLYWGSEQICSNCTSYYICKDFLLYTTTSHKLLIVPLSYNIFQMLAKKDPNCTWTIGSRKIERGAKIVNAVVATPLVILQMPRGNLEMITPRMLLIHTIKILLNDHNYKLAVELMRKHRIDMNLVYDHNPIDFENNVHSFVKKLNDPHLIDLFIANLNETDVTKTLYKVNYFDIDNTDVKCDKVNSICTLVREAMTDHNMQALLLPILTSHVKMNNMDIAIKIIQDMKYSDKNEEKLKAEEGLRHLLYIADANQLFDVALGTYDFDLVMMVFEKSQKDPKEYLPFLNNLKKLEENYRKFKIDVHLRHFKKALENIKPCSDDHIEECVNLIKKENLYNYALMVFACESKLYIEVAKEYAAHLFTSMKYMEAALMFEKCRDLDKTLMCFLRIGHWRQAITTAFKLKHNQDRMIELYNEIVDNLIKEQQFYDAAQVYEIYLKNEEEAIVHYLNAYNWDDALRVAYSFNRLDLIETNIKPAIQEQIKSHIYDLDDKLATFKNHVCRLNEVRTNLEQRHLDFLDGKFEDELDNDLYSDSSTITGASRMYSHVTRSLTGSSKSGKSHRSSKSKRKLERKKHSTKEGSAYEDLGIVTALHCMITDMDNNLFKIKNILPILVNFEMNKDAQILQYKLKEYIDFIKKSLTSIWLLNENTPPEDTTISNDTQNVIKLRLMQLDFHLQYPPILKNSNTSWHLDLLSDV